MRGEQLGRALEEVLGRHGEELCLILGCVRIEERELAALDGIKESFELAGELVRPGGQRTVAGGEA